MSSIIQIQSQMQDQARDLNNQIATLSDPALFLKESLKKSEYGHITFTNKGCNSSLNYTSGQAIDLLWLDYQKQVRLCKVSMIAAGVRSSSSFFPKTDLSSAFDIHKTQVFNDLKEKLQVCMAYSNENHDEIDRFIEIITDRNKIETKAVILHFIWQIKRKILSKEVTHHLMPILYSLQGAGKTFAVNKLLTPVRDWVSNVSLQQICDEKSQFGINRNFVAFADELSRATNADIESLKNRITSDSTSVVLKYENAETFIKNNLSFIGCTNKPIIEMIQDTTGMRRFFQIDYKPPVFDSDSKTYNFAPINSINFQEIWDSVNPDLEHGYVQDIQLELAQIQDKSRQIDSIESFCDDVDFREGLINASEEIGMKQIFTAYKDFCEASGFKYPVNFQQLKTKFENSFNIQFYRKAKAKNLLKVSPLLAIKLGKIL